MMIIVGSCSKSHLSVEFLLWIVYVIGYSLDYFRAADPSQKCHSSGSAALLFMSVAPAPELSVFMAPDPALASVRLHTLIFRLSWCASS